MGFKGWVQGLGSGALAPIALLGEGGEGRGSKCQGQGYCPFVCGVGVGGDEWAIPALGEKNQFQHQGKLVSSNSIKHRFEKGKKKYACLLYFQNAAAIHSHSRFHAEFETLFNLSQ